MVPPGVHPLMDSPDPAMLHPTPSRVRFAVAGILAVLALGFFLPSAHSQFGRPPGGGFGGRPPGGGVTGMPGGVTGLPLRPPGGAAGMPGGVTGMPGGITGMP